MAVNGSFVSPTADAQVAHQLTQVDVNGIVATLLNSVNGWTIVLTTLMVCLAYDQCKCRPRAFSTCKS